MGAGKYSFLWSLTRDSAFSLLSMSCDEPFRVLGGAALILPLGLCGGAYDSLE